MFFRKEFCSHKVHQSNIQKIIGLAFLVALLNLAPPRARAHALNDITPSTFTLYFENDTFFGTDYLYTNGVKLSWTSPDLEGLIDNNRLGSWAYALCGLLPFVGEPEFKRSASLSIGQNMYTPEDTERTELSVGDRPYAGLTYLEMGLHGKSNRRMHSWALILGAVGPHSYAEDTQRVIHEWKDEDVPQGWPNQLKDEPVINLFFTQSSKILQRGDSNGWGYDIIPNWGAGFGNLFIGAYAGAQIRFGWNLPSDFGTSLIRPGSNTNASLSEQNPRFSKTFHEFGVHIFTGMDGTLVIRNLALDGNTFQTSHSVDKEPLIGAAMVGLGFTLYRFKISFAHVYRTKEFKGQKDQEEYGSFTLSFAY